MAARCPPRVRRRHVEDWERIRMKLKLAQPAALVLPPLLALYASGKRDDTDESWQGMETHEQDSNDNRRLLLRRNQVRIDRTSCRNGVVQLSHVPTLDWVSCSNGCVLRFAIVRFYERGASWLQYLADPGKTLLRGLRNFSGSPVRRGRHH